MGKHVGIPRVQTHSHSVESYSLVVHEIGLMTVQVENFCIMTRNIIET